MGIFSRRTARDRIDPPSLPRAQSPENPSTPLSNPDAWVMDWAAAGSQKFGPPVTEQGSMAVSTVFRCVSLLSGLIAGTPLKIYRDDPKLGQIEAPDHKLYPLLGAVPFPGRSLTSFAWREMLATQVYLWGNHFAVIRYDGAGRTVGFEPALPWQVNVWRLPNGENRYEVQWSAVNKEIVAQDDIIHVGGPGFDGIRGLSRIQAYARNAISLASVLEEQTARVHENAAKPSGMVSVPPNISPEGLRRMDAHFNERYVGRGNAGKVMFVDGDSKYTPLQMTPEDLNTISARGYSAEDICRFFGVHPVLAGITSNVTAWGTGIEQITRGFLVYTLEGEFQRIEHELNYKLLSGSSHYVKFDREALLSLDAVAAATMMQTQINSGLLTPNEGRAKLKRAAMKNGDVLLVNSTMITLDNAVNRPATPVPAPGATPPEPAPKKKDSEDA